MTQLAEMRNDLDARELELAWSDGSAARLPHRMLRARCPCAECRQLVRAGAGVHSDRGIVLIAIEPYGPNAVQLKFSDGHERGLFPFEYLRELAVELHGNPSVFVEPLDKARDPPVEARAAPPTRKRFHKPRAKRLSQCA